MENGMNADNPMQPIFIDKNGTARFKANAIVRFLLDWSSGRGMDLNQLAIMNFSDEDREQFAQLIGYSVSGFGDLSYVREESVVAADAIADELLAAKGGA